MNNPLIELRDIWIKERPNYKVFCKDGILVNDIWEITAPKILFLLKESYGNFSDISGPLGPYGSSKIFWRKMKIWTYVITEVINNSVVSIDKIWAVKELPNDSIAYVNIKKNIENVDNNWKSNYHDILKYATTDKEYLVNQIDLINPNIIFCCGTIDFLKVLYPESTPIFQNVYKIKNKFIIAHTHPSYFKTSYEQEFNSILEIANKIKSYYEF